MLLEQPFFWIQITETKSSAGSILTQTANIFICSSDLLGHQQSYQTHEKILFRTGLICASTNQRAALDGEQRQGSSEGS